MTSPAEQQNPAAWEKYTDLSVGEVLRRTRTHYGLTLEDVAQALHIRAAQLGALETGETERLPGRVYAIGFVRAYAEYLGLDGDKVVHLFKAQSVGGRQRPALAMPIPASESKAPNKAILVGSIVALFALFVALGVAGARRHPTAEAIPPAPVVLPGNAMQLLRPPLAAALASASDAVQPVAVAATAPVSVTRITIHAVDAAWIEVRDDKNKPLISNILKAGDNFNVPDQPGYKLDTGNLGALQILLDGKAVPPLGKAGDVRRGINLDPVALKTGTAVPPPAAQADKPAHRKTAAKPAPDDAASQTRHADHFSGASSVPYYNQ